MTVEEIYMAILSSVGLVCNAVSFSFFIEKRGELGNLLLSYLNIADVIVNLAVFLYLIAPALQDVFTSMVLVTISEHVFRSSILVTGLITIYLNILRTSAIVWPMLRFKRRHLHVSLIILNLVFVVVEVFLGVFYTYPLSTYYNYYAKLPGVETPPPSIKDNQIAQFFELQPVIFGTPIIFLVTICCVVSAAKLFRPNKTLHEVQDSGARINAAVTVLILGVQYVVCNSIALALLGIYMYYNLHVSRGEAYLLKVLGAMTLILNSALNPILYICRVKKLRQHFVDIARCVCLKKRDEVDRRPSASVREMAM